MVNSRSRLQRAGKGACSAIYDPQENFLVDVKIFAEVSGSNHKGSLDKKRL
jgi:hypothetical protein